ncbi:MAG: hypothetical protein JKY67_00250 [Pseudomonadales bacterium]|nr:hypothetical protein [Pseudomonadales bacterium]
MTGLCKPKDRLLYEKWHTYGWKKYHQGAGCIAVPRDQKEQWFNEGWQAAKDKHDFQKEKETGHPRGRQAGGPSILGSRLEQ